MMEECTVTELEKSGISIEERSDSDKCLLVSDKEDIKTIKQETTKDILDKKENISKPKRVIEHNPYKEVELRKCENRWVRFSDQNIPEKEKETQELFRKFKGILNKLTPQKFTDLAVKAQALDINTEDRLHGCIDSIFEKALKEPNFSIAYANLCRVLSNMKVSTTRLGEDGAPITKETSFRRELLTKCQKEFEKDKRDYDVREIRLQAIAAAPSEEDKKKKQDEFDIWETVARRRSLGNIRFIGELFKLKMLSEGIMHGCILRLLRSTSDHESLECYCRLITTTGKELDHPQAKGRMDRYFQRISEIIEKKKISSRIKFMLQDVQDLRKREWVPRRQEGLKTIDQIHHEAKIEAEAEQEMIKHMSITSNKPYNRDDKKRGVKMSGQDDMGSRRFAEKRQSANVTELLGLCKKDAGSGTSLGQPASFRPGWGKKKKDGQTPPPAVEKERSLLTKNIPQKLSSNWSKRVGQQSGHVGTCSSQRNEKQAILEALKGLTNPGAASKNAAANKLDEDNIRRKTGTLVDEFTENRDQKEARACVTEMESPGQMNILVSQCVLHSIEKSPNHRKYAGKLLDYLVTEKILTKDTILSGFKEVLEMADDLEDDIPKLWDFVAEVLNPLFICKCLTFNDYFSLMTDVGIEYKSPRALARLIQQCATNSTKAITTELWNKSGLTWTTLGLDQPEEEFLEREKLLFLLSTSASTSENTSVFEDPPYFKDLVVKFGRSDTSNDEILGWIETQKFEKDTLFIRSLSRASVEASTSGEGDSCILSDDRFRNRLPIIKKWVDENESLQKEILNAMQISMDKLKHPPSMLSTVLWSLYDVEVVSEKACYDWRDKGVETIGRGMALINSKRFLDWLEWCR